MILISQELRPLAAKVQCSLYFRDFPAGGGDAGMRLFTSRSRIHKERCLRRMTTVNLRGPLDRQKSISKHRLNTIHLDNNPRIENQGERLLRHTSDRPNHVSNPGPAPSRAR